MKHDTDDQILTADRNAWRARAIELHKAARAYMQVADEILVSMRYRDDPTYDSAAIDLGDLLNERLSAIGAALVAKHGPWNGHAPECRANPINVGHKLHECGCRLTPADQPSIDRLPLMTASTGDHTIIRQSADQPPAIEGNP